MYIIPIKKTDLRKLNDKANTAVKIIFDEGKISFIKKSDKNTQIVVGAGVLKTRSLRSFIKSLRSAIRLAKLHRINDIAISFKDCVFTGSKKINPADLMALVVSNIVLAEYDCQQFKTAPDDGWHHIKNLYIFDADEKTLKDAIAKGEIIGTEMNKTRDLANTPGGNMTPKLLAKKAKEALAGTKANVIVYGEAQMQKLNLHAVLGVGQGSQEESQFIVIDYLGFSKSGKSGKDAPIVLVGKGVTFDSGGINLKPDSLEMHMDMSGGAAVIHTLAIIAKLGIKKHVIGIIPAVENMPSGSSYRPGDILQSHSGKTIEIVNTDAEGRVIMADALSYAKQYNPRLVVDVATLTGASLIALGTTASAIMTPEKQLEDLLRKLGDETAEPVWPFPLWDEYEPMIRGHLGDVANIPVEGNTRYAGVIGGGMFLYQFAKDYPWVHIDMAPRMTSAKGDNLAKGATGAPIQLLVKLIEDF